jgi:glucoamylase
MSDGDRPPGYPGTTAHWTSSAKDGVGTSASRRSCVWFTMADGVVNEIYYPRVDQANTRLMEFVVTDGESFVARESSDTASTITPLAPGVPGYRIVSTCANGRFRMTRTLVTDPERDSLIQEVRFEPRAGHLADFHLYALLAPHLDNQGAQNTGWVGDYKGVPLLFAQREHTTLALASSVGFLATSCGYIGTSDGWTQLDQHKRLVNCYPRADDGNIALTAELDLTACDGRVVVVIAFGPTPAEAGQDARATLLEEFDATCREYVRGWTHFQRHTAVADAASEEEEEAYRLSAAVLKTHEDKWHAGGIIASLSIPWGANKGDHDLGGYHVAWPRDLVECAGGLLAAGHADSARHALHFLMCTQDADGCWPQNMWLDGTAWWKGIQLDEVGFPILLADHLRRRRALGSLKPWEMVRRAAAYLARNGPVTPEDRWEEDGGYSPFTLAVEIAALLAAADFADDAHEPDVSRYLRETADAWNSSIERWTYVTDTALSREQGVDGYYVRIAPRDAAIASDQGPVYVPLRNHPRAESRVEYEKMVGTDALALVRFGLRRPDDERMRNTVRVIDATLRTSTRTGPVWHRYNKDGYGEHEDGSPFDGTGIGRGWPLLAGERGHYALAAGRDQTARHLRATMRAQSSEGGLIPEQVWDAPDLPERGLYNGHPTGSAMPLAWAHAEYVKLARSLRDGQIFDMPRQTRKRYLESKHESPYATWRFNNKARTIPAGRTLRVEMRADATVHWSTDGWRTVNDTPATDTTLGVWYADLPTGSLAEGGSVVFTFHWRDPEHWQGEDFTVCVGGA